MASIYPVLSDPVLASIGWPVCDLHTGPERVQLKAPGKWDLDQDERLALSFSKGVLCLYHWCQSRILEGLFEWC